MYKARTVQVKGSNAHHSTTGYGMAEFLELGGKLCKNPFLISAAHDS